MSGSSPDAGPGGGDGSLSSHLRTLRARLDAAAAAGRGAGTAGGDAGGNGRTGPAGDAPPPDAVEPSPGPERGGEPGSAVVEEAAVEEQAAVVDGAGDAPGAGLVARDDAPVAPEADRLDDGADRRAGDRTQVDGDSASAPPVAGPAAGGAGSTAAVAGPAAADEVGSPVAAEAGSSAALVAGPPAVDEVGSPVAAEAGSTAVVAGPPAVDEVGSPVAAEAGSSAAVVAGPPAVDEVGSPVAAEAGSTTVVAGSPAPDEVGSPVAAEAGSSAAVVAAPPGTDEPRRPATDEAGPTATDEAAQPATEEAGPPATEEAGGGDGADQDAGDATGPGAPTPRRRRGRRFGRVRTAVFAVTLAALVAAIPFLTWLGVETISDSSRGKVIEPETDASAPGFEALVEPTPTLLLAHEDADGRLAGLTVLGLGFGDEGGDVLFVPVGTMADIPEVGLDRLGVAFDRGGLDLVRTATEGLLDVRFTETVAVDAARWTALVEPVAPLTVDNPDDVVVVDEDGSATVAFPAGTIEVGAGEVSSLLGTPSLDETQLARLVRHQAFWEAWLAAVGSAPSGSALPGEVATGIGRFVRGLAAGDVVYETLRVASAGATPDGDEVYEADPDAVAGQISELLPFAAAPEGGDRARVRILNGTGDPALTPVVTRVLVPAGAEIAVIGNADRFDYDRTQVVYYDQAQAEVAERLRDAMGVGEVVLSHVPNESVDVTVVVGSDFALPAATEGGQDGGSDSTG